MSNFDKRCILNLFSLKLDTDSPTLVNFAFKYRKIVKIVHF